MEGITAVRHASTLGRAAKGHLGRQQPLNALNLLLGRVSNHGS